MAHESLPKHARRARIMYWTGTSFMLVSSLVLAVYIARFTWAYWYPTSVAQPSPLIPSRNVAVSADGTPSPGVSQPTLEIPKLNITVPIVTNVNTASNHLYNLALTKGVAQMSGTAAVDAAGGNTVIFGHSSRFAPSGSAFDYIFAPLPKLNVGDEIDVTLATGVVKYNVTHVGSVGANDVSVLNQGSARQITLMTCWPIGTTLKRWVVVAQPSNVL